MLNTIKVYDHLINLPGEFITVSIIINWIIGNFISLKIYINNHLYVCLIRLWTYIYIYFSIYLNSKKEYYMRSDSVFGALKLNFF